MNGDDDYGDDDIDPTSPEYESGPFCPHWSDPCDCEEKCARCGHGCPKHMWDACDENGCDCPGFIDAKDEVGGEGGK